MWSSLYVRVEITSENGEEFQQILSHMQHYGYPQGDSKDSV